ncbi:hypothetical protein WR25_13396 [Diploscapter pachys]|uniref:Uncharacterized protein n=1 Tax=Diploscapter pachys TaxID=2018661 RepID=A0A2A2J3U7_9BILA|nr:hypothetical protein WR25_13396 [Diploscapter pachys]
MEIGRAFYPAPHITMPHIDLIPVRLKADEMLYDFEAEFKARREYDEMQDEAATASKISESVPKQKEPERRQEEVIPAVESTSNQNSAAAPAPTLSAIASSSSSFTTSVLVPSTLPLPLLPSVFTSQLPSTSSAGQSSQNSVASRFAQMKFDEFEQKASCFDELEWKSIDEKEALKMILQPQLPAVAQSQSAPPVPSHQGPSSAPPILPPQIPIRNPK